MKKYRIKVDLEGEVEANDDYEAMDLFWERLEYDNVMENTTTEIRLGESMEVKEIEDD